MNALERNALHTMSKRELAARVTRLATGINDARLEVQRLRTKANTPRQSERLMRVERSLDRLLEFPK